MGLRLVLVSPASFSDDDWNETKDSKKIKLSEEFTVKGQKYIYIYDFGDDWTHKITLEEMKKVPAKHADCIGGKSKCPPEDCSGPWGYEEFKHTMPNPKHPEHKEM